MKDDRTTPLRERMIEDMRIRGIKETTQKGHIRAVKNFAAFLGRPPDTATPDELRQWEFASGAMAPKVAAASRFVEQSGGIAGIGRLEDAQAILEGRAGTFISRQ